MSKPSFTLFIPVLNELEGMKLIMPRIDSSWCDQILIIDGGSTDGSIEYAQKSGYEVYVQKKKGIRYAYNEGWPLIRSQFVITFTPDGNCIPEIIPTLKTKILEGFDMVIASRYFGGIKSEDDDPLTGFGNWMFTSLINLLHSGSYTDAMGIFRAYRKDLFFELGLDTDKAYGLEKILGTVAGIEPLLSIRAARSRLKIGEISGPEPRRIAGERKLQMFRWGGVYLWQTLKEAGLCP